MSLYKTNTINPLNVTDERVVSTIPPYFTKIILNKSTKNTIRSSNPVLATLTKQIKQIDQWIYLNLEGRYGIQKQIVTTDEQVYITSESKQRRGGRLTQDELFDIIWYIEWQVGFEIPNEASYFALSCEYLN